MKFFNKIFTYVLLLFCLSLSSTAFTHSGGINAKGCHFDRDTRNYHYHSAGSKKLRGLLPAKTVKYCVNHRNGNVGCGYQKSSCERIAKNYNGYCSVES